jgi:hypothetical protein
MKRVGRSLSMAMDTITRSVSIEHRVSSQYRQTPVPHFFVLFRTLLYLTELFLSQTVQDCLRSSRKRLQILLHKLQVVDQHLFYAAPSVLHRTHPHPVCVGKPLHNKARKAQSEAILPANQRCVRKRWRPLPSGVLENHSIYRSIIAFLDGYLQVAGLSSSWCLRLSRIFRRVASRFPYLPSQWASAQLPL